MLIAEDIRRQKYNERLRCESYQTFGQGHIILKDRNCSQLREKVAPARHNVIKQTRMAPGAQRWINKQKVKI